MKDRIKELRKSLNLNQAEFGERIGVKQQTVTAYECGNRIPLDVTIVAMSREFGANEEWIRTGEGSMFQPKSSEEQIADVLAAFTNAPEGSFVNRLAKALSRLDDKDWDEIARIVEKMAEK